MSDEKVADDASAGARTLALVAGPAVYLALLWLAPASLRAEAQQVLAIAGWMAVWWLTEVVPLAVTSLLPIALFPLLGIATTREAAAPYANDIVFLFLAGFLLAAALERWNAHARIAYAIVLAIGTSGRRVVLGVMLATAAISLWISNTATTAMMYPIALAVGALFGDSVEARRMRTSLMLGVAYAASIGGMGTLIGTPPNLVFAGAAKELAGVTIGFVDFMLVGIPIVLVLLPLCWALLVFVLFRANIDIGAASWTVLRERRAALGPLRGGEALAVAVFAATGAAWLLRERKDFGTFVMPGLVDAAAGISDASIAVSGAILLFLLRGRDATGHRRPLLLWREARQIPWEVLLLFGGGLSLASAMESSGLAAWMGGQLIGLADLPTPLLLASVALAVLALSELASNTAVAALAMPIVAALAVAAGQPPVTLMLVAGLAASTGFALPAATPPNAIVFGSGQITVREMARAGILLDLVSIPVIVAAVLLLGPLLS